MGYFLLNEATQANFQESKRILWRPFWYKVYYLFLKSHCVLVLCSWKNGCFLTQILSMDKLYYLNTFLHQTEAIVYTTNYIWASLFPSILVQDFDKFMHSILWYCVILNSIVLLIFCYVDIIQYNAMHKFVRVLDNPPLFHFQ